MFNKKNAHSAKKQKCRISKSHKTLLEIDKEEDIAECKFDVLNSDSLEHIASFLETSSALALYRSSRDIMQKLACCSGFWKSLCEKENFHEYSALKHEDENGDSPRRLSWAGRSFHDVDIPEETTLSHKIFIRGIQMRRNICSGNYELWRLFMTGKECLPIKKMMKNTTSRELRSNHRKSSFNEPKRRVCIESFWSEDYLVAIQQKMAVNNSFIDIFVWKWKEFRNPEFSYSYDLLSSYPTGLISELFFHYKNFLVLMPETNNLHEEKVRSMIRVHDLANNMTLVGSYDFPENGYRRHTKCYESPHLSKIGDHVVALCRTPNFMFLVFSLPNCKLVYTVPVLNNPERPLELDVLAGMFMIEDNTIMFKFNHPEFYEEEENQSFEQKYGQMLLVDFEKFLKSGEPLVQKIDSKFDSNMYYIQPLSMISKTEMACVTISGSISIREVISTNASTVSFIERLSIPCPEAMRDKYDVLTNELNIDVPGYLTASSVDIILIFRHFTSGRKIHAYKKEGSVLYTIDIDAPELELEKKPGYLSIAMDGNFLCAADQNKIVLWNSKTGKFVNTIDIPAHYSHKEDDEVYGGQRGHADFAFAEDGVVIIHNQRNFPIAADVLFFW